MDISIKGHHIEVTEAIKGSVEAAIKRIKDHYDCPMDVRVTLTVDKAHDEKHRYKAEVNVHVQGKVLHASASSHDMYIAIDDMGGKVGRQLSRDKGKK